MDKATVKIQGPPGTGKTTFLLELVATAIESGKYRPDRIGYLSFSRAAAEEAKERVLQVIPDLRRSDLVNWGTIHSICRRLLEIERDQIFTGQAVKVFAEKSGFYLSAQAPDAEQVFLTPASYNFGDLCLSIQGYQMHTDRKIIDVLDRFNRGQKYPISFADYMDFVRKYQDFKSDRGFNLFFDFNDMLQESITRQTTLPVDLLIIDEAQDMSLLLWRVITQWAQKGINQVIIAGDPYQAIYEFQGADPELMLSWPAEYTITLDRSFRCPGQIYQASRKIVSRMSQRYENDSFVPNGPGGHVEKGCKKFHPGKGESIFLLARTNQAINSWVDFLLEKHVPFGYLKRRRKSLLHLKGCSGIYTLEKLQKGSKINLVELVDLLDCLPSKDLLKRGAKTNTRKLISHVSTEEEIIDNIGVEDLVNYGFLPKCRDYIIDGAIFSFYTGTTAEVVEYVRGVIKKYGVKVQKQRPGVRVGTIHSAKGMEADRVIIDAGLPKKVLMDYLINQENEHRLGYVGVTRARKNVNIITRSNDDYSYPVGPFTEPDLTMDTLDRSGEINKILGLENHFAGTDLEKLLEVIL